MSTRIDLSRKGDDESFLMTRNGQNYLKYWCRTNSKGGQLVKDEKLWHLADSGYKTHKIRPTESGGIWLRYLVELLLNKRYDTLAALTQQENCRPKFDKGMTNMESTDLPNTRHKCEGVSCSRATAAQTTFIVSFPFPQPYGWVLLSCFTSSREITGARYKPILQMSPPKYF